MDFQRARTKQQIAHRQTEILNACAALYETCGAEGVTIKAIAERTSFSRPSIYNYYETKEEILLGLLQRECTEFSQELEDAFHAADHLDRVTFCRLMTDALLRHENMLHLLTVNLNMIENNSRLERLVEFKRCMAALFQVLRSGLAKGFPNSKPEARELFLTNHFCFLYGLYPVTHPTPKQVTAMEQANFILPKSFDILCQEGLLLLTSDL